MAKKKTLREKLGDLLDEAVVELTDELRVKNRKVLEEGQYLRKTLQAELDAKKCDFDKKLEAAEAEYLIPLGLVVKTGLLALKLGAIPKNTVEELVELAHSAIPEHRRQVLEVPNRLMFPKLEQSLSVSSGSDFKHSDSASVDVKGDNSPPDSLADDDSETTSILADEYDRLPPEASDPYENKKPSSFGDDGPDLD